MTSGQPASARSGTEDGTRVGALVVTLDGSPFAEHALPVAAQIAARLGTELHLLSVVPHAGDETDRTDDLDALAASHGVVRTAVVVDPDAALAINRYVADVTGAVVCMASHGRGRSAAVIGSVTNDVLARSHAPVLVVGPAAQADGAEGNDSGASGVLACLDETPGSIAVLEAARRWARLLGEPIVAVTVAEPVPEPLIGHEAQRRFGPGDPEAALASAVTASDGGSDAVEYEVLWDPISPADGIDARLRERPASLVVIGSRARHRITRLALGSVSADVVRASRAPVLVVPHADAQGGSR
jgi:nucleotide-binding universal stress UspA family protein